MSELLEAALSYHDMGLSVIPLQPGGKTPLIKWSDYSTRQSSKEEIRIWWGNTPNANIGIVTGKVSNIIAVDIDVDRGGDPREIFNIAPTGLISRTGGGGYHLLYSYDDAVARNKVGRNGIDTRSNGGYIVAPPSIHSSGNKYSWMKYEDIGRINNGLTNYLVGSSNTLQEDKGNWITELLGGVFSGSRNDACAKLAGYYAGKAIPKDVALSLLLEWNFKNKPPMPDSEVITTVNSVYSTAQRSVSNITQKAPTEYDNEFKVIKFDQYMREFGDSEVPWIIPEWLPEQTIAFATSPPGTYKTWMLLDLAISVATGTNFLNQFPVDRSGSVILIQQEDYQGGLAERLGVIVNSRFGVLKNSNSDNFELVVPPDIPIYFHAERKLKFNDKAIMNELEKAIMTIKPKLVIIDPLYSAAETDDYMAKSATDMFRLKKMRDDYGCAFIIAHHKKKKAEGNDREGLWGSQFLNAFLETGWQIRSLGDTSVSIRRHFKVKKETAEVNVDFDISTDLPYRYEVNIKEGIGEKEFDIIQILEKGGPMNFSELATKMGIHRSTVSRKIKLLEADKVVVKNPDGKYCLLSSVNDM